MEQHKHQDTSKHSLVGRWSKRLQERWHVSGSQVLIILLVFACTGVTVLLLKRPIVSFFVGEGQTSTLFSVIYYILILPIYNVILLIYGLIFGQFNFFWNFEKKMFKRLFGRFQSKN